MSSAGQRPPIACASRAIESLSVRSIGAIVALPPAAWMRSSISSSPPVVRAVSTTCAPCAASASAVAAPIPREAPVTSAIWSARGLVIKTESKEDQGRSP